MIAFGKCLNISNSMEWEQKVEYATKVTIVALSSLTISAASIYYGLATISLMAAGHTVKAVYCFGVFGSGMLIINSMDIAIVPWKSFSKSFISSKISTYNVATYLLIKSSAYIALSLAVANCNAFVVYYIIKAFPDSFVEVFYRNLAIKICDFIFNRSDLVDFNRRF